MTAIEIRQEVANIAGCMWDDRSAELRRRPLHEQIHTVADAPSQGTDGDLTAADRMALHGLAAQAKAAGL